jgi:alanine racemase
MNARRLTQATIHLERLTHNLRLLQAAAGARALWPVVKANAYGHGARLVARQLISLGCDTLGVADVAEAAALADAGIEASFIVLSATLPEHAEALAAYGCEPVLCTLEMAAAVDGAARELGRRIAVHVKVDTGMGRIGIAPREVARFLVQLRAFPALEVKGLMSHFARADEADKGPSLEQTARFREAIEAAQPFQIAVRHMANSAALLDLPAAHFDAVRPGIALYGWSPSGEIANPLARELLPVLEWTTRIVFLKEVPAGTGLSYGHAFRTERPSLIATVPVGYADGLSRRLSGNLDMLVRGVRCPQVGRITMDMSLLDVSALRGAVALGDEVMILGRQGAAVIAATELAQKLGTLHYEVLSAIAARVSRAAASPPSS